MRSPAGSGIGGYTLRGRGPGRSIHPCAWAIRLFGLHARGRRVPGKAWVAHLPACSHPEPLATPVRGPAWPPQRAHEGNGGKCGVIEVFRVYYTGMSQIMAGPNCLITTEARCTYRGMCMYYGHLELHKSRGYGRLELQTGKCGEHMVHSAQH